MFVLSGYFAHELKENMNNNKRHIGHADVLDTQNDFLSKFLSLHSLSKFLRLHFLSKFLSLPL